VPDALARKRSAGTKRQCSARNWSRQNTFKGKDLWHSWKCEAEERCQSIRICRNVDTQNLLVQLDSPSLGLHRMSSPDLGGRHLDSSFYVHPTGPSHLHQNARVDRLVRAQLSGIRLAMYLAGCCTGRSNRHHFFRIEVFAHGHRCELH
jgi:hypothetical protein